MMDAMAEPSSVPTFDCRASFAETLIELARTDPRIVAVCNDSVGSSNLNAFQKEFPDRLINVGIAEQNMVGVAAGLANGGFVPYVSCASPFLTGRALEQIKADVAYNNYHVVLCGQSPGHVLWRVGADASFDRRFRLDARFDRDDDHCAGRPEADAGRGALGGDGQSPGLHARRPL